MTGTLGTIRPRKVESALSRRIRSGSGLAAAMVIHTGQSISWTPHVTVDLRPSPKVRNPTAPRASPSPADIRPVSSRPPRARAACLTGIEGRLGAAGLGRDAGGRVGGETTQAQGWWLTAIHSMTTVRESLVVSTARKGGNVAARMGTSMHTSMDKVGW